MNKVQASEINLTTNEALVLQQVYEDGSDDAATLFDGNRPSIRRRLGATNDAR